MANWRVWLMVLLALECGRAWAAEPKEMTWLTIDFAPVSIKDGPEAGTGYTDLSTTYLAPLLFPGYKQKTLYGPPLRLDAEMQKGENSCSLIMLQTPRRMPFMIFSQPYERILPNGIITLKSNLSRLEGMRSPGGAVSLARLVANRTLRGGVAQGRVYGPGIDAVLGPVVKPPAPNIMSVAGTKLGEGLYEMLQRDRVDYFIGYAVEEHYFFHHRPLARESAYMPVEEANALVAPSFSCARTAWGEQKVQEMNRLLESKNVRQKLQEIYEKHLSPDQLKLYREWLTRKLLEP